MGKQEKPGAVFGFCAHIHFKGIWSEGESGGTGAPPEEWARLPWVGSRLLCRAHECGLRVGATFICY